MKRLNKPVDSGKPYNFFYLEEYIEISNLNRPVMTLHINLISAPSSIYFIAGSALKDKFCWILNLINISEFITGVGHECKEIPY